MSVDTYANFRTSIGTWANATDVTTTSLDDVILMGEKYVNRKLRVREMESSISAATLVAGTYTLASAYIGIKHLRIDGSPSEPLQKKSPEWIYQNYPDRTGTAKPKFFAEDSGKFIFGPHPNTTYTVSGTYYVKPNSLPGTATINSVFTEYPDLYLWASLANAETFLGRDKRLIWQKKVDEAIANANKQEKDISFSGSPLCVTPG